MLYGGGGGSINNAGPGGVGGSGIVIVRYLTESIPTYNISTTIEIGINATDNVEISGVLANVTLPNGSVSQLSLSSTSGNWYNTSYAIPRTLGRYNVTFIVNDTSNNLQSTYTTAFIATRVANLSVTLVSPANASTDSDGNVTFICNASNTALSNLTLYVWNSTGGVYNISTTNVSGETNQTNWTLKNVSDGNYNWNCLVYDTSGNSTFAASNWTFTVSTVVVPLTVSTIECSNDSVNYYSCGSMAYNINITHVRANVTASGNISDVRFNLYNSEDNTNYVNNQSYTYNTSSYYIYNSSYLLRDSGTWNLSVTAYGDGDSSVNSTSWSLDWGNVSLDWIWPTSDVNVTYHQFSTFSVNVTCTGGECGIINVTLDPEECHEEEVCEEIVVGEKCVNETVESCEKNCSVEIVEECVEEVSDVCEIVEKEVCEEECVSEENCGEECETDSETGEETCSETCETVESCEDACERLTEEECEEIVENVCSETEKEVCLEINCIEEIAENCEEVVEKNCTTRMICKVVEDNPSSGGGGGAVTTNGTGNSNVTSVGNKTSNATSENNQTIIDDNPIEIPENQTVVEAPNNETKQYLVGKEFEEGEVIETEEGKDLGEKIEDEGEYETHFLEMEQDEEFRVVFYHDHNGTLPVYVAGNVSYNLDKNESDYLENVTLVVELVKGILPKFELHIGEESEVFEFGKVIPKIELKQGNYTLIDRDDLKLDVEVKFDSEEGVVLRGLEDEQNLSVTLGTNSEADVSTSIIAVPSLNIENATIVLEKTDGVEEIISCDDENFNYETLECSNWKYEDVEFVEENNTIRFSVEHFTAYAGGNVTAGETAFLTIWDYNDVGMSNASANTTSVKVANQTVEFFADYKLAKNATKLSDGNCTIVFSDNSSNVLNMSYNSTYSYFLYERNFTSNGAYTYTVNCTHATYTNLSDSDYIVIGHSTNSSKGGAISMVTGAVPFYTTSQNPTNTSNLRGGSQVINWGVNATGILGKIYDFFVEANGTYVSYTNSSHLNIRITANDTTASNFIWAGATISAVVNGSNVTINANIEDDVQVGEGWGAVTHPSGSNTSFSSLPYIFTNTTEIGRYNVTYYANDSSGNNATATTWFEVGTPLNITVNVTVNVSVEVGVNVSSNFTFRLVHPEFGDVILKREANGSFTTSVPDVVYDILSVETFNETMNLTLREVNLSASINESIRLDKHNQTPESELSNNLVTYGIDTGYNFTMAELVLSYRGMNYNVDFESQLTLWKCNNYSIENRSCVDGSWNNTGESPNIARDYFTYNTTSFSGFAIKEYVASTEEATPTTDDGGGGGDGGSCAEGYELVDGTCVKIEGEIIKVPEQLFDITWNLDDSTIETVGELVGVITLESFGTVPTPVDLTFIILDSDGNEVYRAKGNTTVITEEIMRWKFSDEGLNELADGEYVAVLETLYNVDVFDEFRQEFRVGVKPDCKFIGLDFGRFIVCWYWGVLIVIIVLVSLLIWLLSKRKKKPRKPRVYKQVIEKPKRKVRRKKREEKAKRFHKRGIDWFTRTRHPQLRHEISEITGKNNSNSQLNKQEVK